MIWTTIGGAVCGVIIGTIWSYFSTKKTIKENLTDFMKEKEVEIKNGTAFNWEKETEELLKSKSLSKKEKK